MKRIVQPEILDTLPADNPHAQRSRRDIQRLNLLIGHDRIIANALPRVLGKKPLTKIADLGAGNGEFLFSVAQRLGQQSPVEATLVDIANGFDLDLASQFQTLGWKVKLEIADAVQWLRDAAGNSRGIVLANHFLHQLQEAELKALFAVAAESADGFISAEPRRELFPLFCSHLVWFAGANWVTRNDGPVSFRAGFRAGELSALWPDRENWELIEEPAGMVSHLFIARRKTF